MWPAPPECSLAEYFMPQIAVRLNVTPSSTVPNVQWSLASWGYSAVELYLIARKLAPEGSKTRSRFLRVVTACRVGKGWWAQRSRFEPCYWIVGLCVKRPGFAEPLVKQALRLVFATGQKLHFPASSRRQNYFSRKPERDSFNLSLPPSNRDAEDMWSRSVWRLLLSESSGGRQVSTPRGCFSRALRRGEKRRHVTSVLSAFWRDDSSACSSDWEARVPRPPARPTLGPGAPAAGSRPVEGATSH